MNLCKFSGSSYQKTLGLLLVLTVLTLAACLRAPLPTPIVPPAAATDTIAAPTRSEIPNPFKTILQATDLGTPDYQGNQPMFVVLRSKIDISKFKQIFAKKPV